MSVRLYLKDNTNGHVHEYGTNQHDALILQEDGSLHYVNLQNGTGSMFPEEGYTFCNENGTDPRTNEDYIDIGGEVADLTCDTCRWSGNRHQKCTTCRNNQNLKSRYEPDRTVSL